MESELAHGLDQARSSIREYARASEENAPLGAYATLLATFTACFGTLLILGARRGVLPRRWRAGDLVLLALATHKLTRVLTRDKATAPLRAAFTHYEGSAGHGEVNETARGRGLRRAIGDLVTCPFCAGPWVASALAAGLVYRPRATRAIASVFTAVALSDWLHRGYHRLGA
jgi:hypothetical protein